MSMRSFTLAALSAGLVLLSAAASVAGPISVTYEAAGVMAPVASSVCGTTAGCTVGYETFSYISPGTASSYTSNFSSGTGIASAYSGIYSPIQVNAADQYGGAGGTGNYDVVFGTSNTLTIARTATGGGVNYFGAWISALDAGNQLQFFDANNTLIYTFTSQNLIDALGSCASGHAGNAYCGNPSTSYYNDSGELFAYVNFYDTVGTFSKIIFTQTGGGGFESDNHAVAYNSKLTATPEPSSITLMGLGLAGLFLARRWISRTARSELAFEFQLFLILVHRRRDPFYHRGQRQDALAIGGADGVLLDAIGPEPKHDRRIHGVGHGQPTEQVGPARLG
jgi:hypothetical protein